MCQTATELCQKPMPRARLRREAMDQIQLIGKDGTVWHYYAVMGPEFSAPETGWVLTLVRPPEPIIQALTVEEVVGDIRAMMPGNEAFLGTVMALTKSMIKSLDARAHEGEEFRKRAAALRREYAKAFP